MPLYEFECPKCEGKREEVIKLDDLYAHSGNVVCDECKVYMRRIMSAPAFTFGGSYGKIKTSELIRKRNEDYHKSPKGQEEHRANVEAAHKRLGLS